jgi:hypothetical protein
MNEQQLIDLYTDYLILSTRQTTATGLSSLTDGKLSHDSITRFLTSREYNGKSLWLKNKSIVRKYENDEGCLIFDDTVIEKPYMDENDIVCWHWDHSKGRNVKGIGLVTAYYNTTARESEKNPCIPLSYEIIAKTETKIDPKTGKERRYSSRTKNTIMKEMIEQQLQNNVKFKYILADSWFSSRDNMKFINDKHKTFIFEIKDNILATTNKEERNRSQFRRIEQITLAEGVPLKVWLKDMDFPILIYKQTFKNKDDSVGERILATNDLTMTSDQLQELYKKRWSIEEYHKSIKQNTSLGSSPAYSVRTQSNHIFLSIFAFVKLEMVSLSEKINHFALKSKIYISALKVAMGIFSTMKDGEDCRCLS